MARMKIELPERLAFSTRIPVRIQDINYGGHLGNDALLSILHEARIQYLGSLGCTEMNAFGVSMIMTDAAIVYKGEGFQGDILQIGMSVGDISSRGFDLYYHVSCDRRGGTLVIAMARTGMLCFDYDKRKTTLMPSTLKEKLEST